MGLRAQKFYYEDNICRFDIMRCITACMHPPSATTASLIYFDTYQSNLENIAFGKKVALCTLYMQHFIYSLVTNTFYK